MFLPPPNAPPPSPPSLKHLLSEECVLTCAACQLYPLSLNPPSPYGSAASLPLRLQRVLALLIPDDTLKSFSEGQPLLRSPLGSLRNFIALLSEDITSVWYLLNLSVLSVDNCNNIHSVHTLFRIIFRFHVAWCLTLSPLCFINISVLFILHNFQVHLILNTHLCP